HTRWPRDWSSDVCSSDLGAAKGLTSVYVDNLRPNSTVLRRRLAQKFSQNRRTGSGRSDLATTSPGRSTIRRAPFAQSGHHDFPRSEERRVGKECRERMVG